MSQAYYRKWRPQKWDEVVSQEHIIQTLRNAVRSERIGHAYLLTGPRGTGKTTTARLLAKAINCTAADPADRPCDECEHCKAVNDGRYMDLIEIDAASNTSVEDVRDLRDKVNYRGAQGAFKVYIIDEVHMLSTAAFNALLKTLEEPPPHVKFILATTEVHKIPATILSRCQRYDFRRIPVDEITRYLKAKAAEEGLQVDDEALQLIARQATGAMRDAISLLDQLSSTGDRVTMDEAQRVLGTATSSMVVELVDAVLAQDAAAGLKIIQSALDAGTDARQFARQVVEYLRGLMLVRVGSADQVDVTREMRAQMAEQARAFDPAQLLENIRLFNGAAVDTRSAWNPGLGLELAVAAAVIQPAAAQQEAAGQQPAAKRPASAQQNAAKQQPEEPFEPPALYQSSPEPQRPEPKRVQAPAPADQQPAEKPAAKQPAAESTPAPSGKPSGDSPVTQHDIQHNWPAVKQAVRRLNKMTEGLLNSARSTVLKGDMLVLGFQSEMVKSLMDTPENMEFLRKALHSVLGANINVRCVVVGSKSSSTDLDIDGDGMVGTALDLGGKIVYEE